MKNKKTLRSKASEVLEPFDLVRNELIKTLERCGDEIGDYKTATEIIFFLSGGMILGIEGKKEFKRMIDLVKEENSVLQKTKGDL